MALRAGRRMETTPIMTDALIAVKAINGWNAKFTDFPKAIGVRRVGIKLPIRYPRTPPQRLTKEISRSNRERI